MSRRRSPNGPPLALPRHASRLLGGLGAMDITRRSVTKDGWLERPTVGVNLINHTYSGPYHGGGGHRTMRDHAHVHLDGGRRQFLHTVLTGAVVGIAAHAGSELAAPPTLHATAGAPAAEPDGPEESASELNRKLTNPVSTIWSITNQFNNFKLENGHWNNNWNF